MSDNDESKWMGIRVNTWALKGLKAGILTEDQTITEGRIQNFKKEGGGVHWISIGLPMFRQFSFW